MVEKMCQLGILVSGYKGDPKKYDVDMNALRTYVREHGYDKYSHFGAYLAGKYNK